MDKVGKSMKKPLRYKYDEVSDVLYIFFGNKKSCVDKQIDPGVYSLRNKNTGCLVGITIVDFSRRCQNEAI